MSKDEIKSINQKHYNNLNEVKRNDREKIKNEVCEKNIENSKKY